MELRLWCEGQSQVVQVHSLLLGILSQYAARDTEYSEPCDVEENIEYVGQELESLNTSSLAACVTACVSNSVCRGVSLAGRECSLKYSMKLRYRG